MCMEQKKSRQADLERHRALRWFVGLIIATGLFFAALQIPLVFGGGMDLDEMLLDEIAEEMEFLPDFEQPDLMLAEEKEEEQDNHLSANVNIVEEKKAEEEPAEDETAEVVEKDALPPAPPPPTPQAVDENDEPLPMRIVQQLPEFPGGMSRFITWLSRNLQYPESAKEKKLQGKVVVSFIVNKDGSISNLKVAQSVTPLLDDEAMRVIRQMPKWKPGIQDGKPCRTMFTIPIVFRL